MAGAFLPWEEWIARLIHTLKVIIPRRLYQQRRKRSLDISAKWPQTHGTVDKINWDSSYPREEVVYFYSTQQGYDSGFFWRWFDLSEVREVRAGDRITLRYDPDQHDRSVFVSLG